MASSGYELSDIKQDKDNGEDRRTRNDPDSQLDVVIVDRNSRYLHDDQPRDRYNLVFLILLIHGIGTLMPWNMFINAEDYFRNYKLGNHSSNMTSIAPDQRVDNSTQADLNNLSANFLAYLGLASQLPNVLFNGLNLLVNMGSGNLKLRVNLTLIVEAVIFTMTIILALVDSSGWPQTFFFLTMASVVILNMASGIYQNCIFGTGAKFPGTYTNAILIGSNFSGTFTSTVNLLSIWLAPEPQVAAVYYFITALFVILICIVSYNMLPYNDFFRRFDQADQSKAIGLEIAQEDSVSKSRKDDGIPDILRTTVEAMVPRPESDDNRITFKSELLRKRDVFVKCWPQCLNVFLTFYITLALFPAILADIKQTGNTLSDKYFTPFSCFFIFNVFAMIGNLISSWTTWPGKDRVWMLVAIRVLFIPFFLFCNFKSKTRKWPVLITSDIAFTIGNILLALSSGYLSSLCMMFASSGLQPSEAPQAGMLAAFFLVFGIFLGINSSLILNWIVN